jgi:phospholipase C
VAVTVLAMAVSGFSATGTGTLVPRTPGSRPDPSRPAGTDTLPGVDHLVVLMLENHSFDNLFGMLGRGDGFVLDGQGQPIATNPYPISPVNEQIVGGVAMGYWTGADLPFTYGLASVFPVADRWFSSSLAQTDPQRRYLIAGTSAGMTDNPGTTNLIGDLGLLIPAARGTIFNQLDSHGIGWANYVASYASGATPNLFLANDLVTEAAHKRPFAQFATDAAAGSLPAFSLLDPNFGTQSQENPQNIVKGEAMLAQVVDAIGGPMVERKWNLPALAAPGNTPAALACSTSGPGAIPPPGSITG